MKSYFEITPPRNLAHLVECFWVITKSRNEKAAHFDRIFPDGAADIVLAGDELTAHGSSTSFRLMPRLPSAGMRIRRGAAKTVLGVNPAEIEHGPVLLEALWGRSVQTLHARASLAPTPIAQIEAFADFLSERFATGVQSDSVVLAATRLLDHSAALGMRAMTERLDISERQLRRRFRDQFGFGIKQYARIVRFQRVVDAVRIHKRGAGACQPSWAGMAADYGYADQAHLIREVAEFAGLTPVELLQAL
jgi:AraC-like DNA-binding protein